MKKQGQKEAGGRRGFTVTEMLIVVLVIAIIGAVAIPQASGLRAPALTTAASIMAADIEFCQSECINNPSDLRVVVFNTTTNQYSLARAATSGTPLNHPADSLPYVNDFSTGRNSTLSGVTLSSVSGVSGNLTFDQFGKPGLAANATITLSNGHSTITVTVDYATGEVTVGNPT